MLAPSSRACKHTREKRRQFLKFKTRPYFISETRCNLARSGIPFSSLLCFFFFSFFSLLFFSLFFFFFSFFFFFFFWFAFFFPCLCFFWFAFFLSSSLSFVLSFFRCWSVQLLVLSRAYSVWSWRDTVNFVVYFTYVLMLLLIVTHLLRRARKNVLCHTLLLFPLPWLQLA